MVRLPFQGFFNRIVSAFKKQKPKEGKPIQPPKQEPEFIKEKRSVLAFWLGIAKENPRNITRQSKEMMIQLAEEKRERKRKRNLRLIRRTQ